MTARRGPILAIDTATATAVAALGHPDDGELIAEERWNAGYRHGEELLPRIDRLLAGTGIALADLDGIVVGTGPGAFTGLRVGLATAKGLAHALGLPIAGVPTGSALLSAARRARDAADAEAPTADAEAPTAAIDGDGRPFALLLPAGPGDRTLVRDDGSPPTLLVGTEEPDLAPRTVLVAVDLDGRAPEAALARGRRAVAGLGAVLVEIGGRRLAETGGDDLAELVPEYVTLPRGVRALTGAVTWSRDPR